MTVGSSRRASRTTWGLAALSVAAVLYAISVQQFFWADGSHFFLKLLEDRTFTYSVDFPRHHAHYFTQALPVVLLRVFDVRDLSVLSFSYGLGMYLPQFVSMAACYFLLRREDLRFMVFPILGQFGISANHEFMVSHEMHVATALFWPLLTFILLHEEFDWKDSLLALALSVLFIRTYETVALTGTFLLLCLGLRFREGWRKTEPRTTAVRLCMAAILLGGVVIAVRFAAFPLHPKNRGDLIESFGRIPRHWPAMMSFAFIAVITLFALVPRLARSPLYRICLAVLVPVTLVVGLSPSLIPQAMRPELQHAARGYMVIMPLVLAVPAVLLLRRFVVVPDDSWKRITALVTLLVLGQTTWQLLATAQWNGFRKVFQEELASHRGPTAFENTSLTREQTGVQVIYRFTWAWTNPTLSVLWAKD